MISKFTSIIQEINNLGIRGTAFRVNYELSKKLGLVEKKHPSLELSLNELIQSLDLKNPELADVENAYNSKNLDKAISEFIKYLKSRQSPEFFFHWQDFDKYNGILNEHFMDQRPQLLEQADGIINNEFEIFGNMKVKFDDEVNWHCDPETGMCWPLTHWSRIDIRGSKRIGDVKFVWEMNRHQFLFILGRAYWFTGDEKYAKKASDLMKSWLSNNPPEIGINWYSNLEIAIRLISWIWAYHFFLRSPSFDDKLIIGFLKFILQSCRHIIKDFKYSLLSMKNNHVIGDATAIALAGIMFPEFKESKLWRDNYIKILYRELDLQVNSDGTDFEQSLSYHKFVLYFFLIIFRIMQINKYDIKDYHTKKIEKMLEFMMYVMRPDGTIPHIGDCDDANLLPLSNQKANSMLPVLSNGSVLFQRGDFKKTAGRLMEETIWLCGTESLEIFHSLKEVTPPIPSKGFPDGGYYIMRSSFDAQAKYLLLKCGPPADHGHADDLHIEMCLGQRGCLQDCGTYTYNGPIEWRNFFRSTRAHNTVLVDNESQRIPHRVFRWIKAGEAKTNIWIASRNFDYIDAEHSGYKRYKDPVVHNRMVFFVKPEYWLIIDRLIAKGEHKIELIFHTPSDDVLPESCVSTFRTRDFSIIPVDTYELNMIINQCSEEPIQGWYSPCYGAKKPSNSLSYIYTGKLPRTMSTIIAPSSSVLNPKLLFQNNEKIIINIELSDFIDYFLFNWNNDPHFPIIDVKTDAKVVYLRKDIVSNKINRIAMIYGSYIEFNGKIVLKAKTPLQWADVSGEEIILEPITEVNIDLMPLFISSV